MSTIRTRGAAALVVLAVTVGVLTAAGPPAATADGGGARPTGLTIGQRSAPADIDDVAAPILGWQVPTDEQTAYQVQVAETAVDLVSGRRLVWDSGRVRSAESTNVPYAGRELDRGERYVWRVRTWDGHRSSPWSRPAEFGTALGGDWGDSEPIWLETPEFSSWHDYTLEATFSITTQNASIVFNAQDPNNYLMWQLRGDGVDQLAPHQRVNDAFQVLKTVPLETDLLRDTDHRLRIEVAGTTVRTWLDGVLVDTTEGVPFAGGTIGFRTGGGERSSWDDISVTAADGTVLYDNSFDAAPSDFLCGAVVDGRLAVGTSQNCLYGSGTSDWAFLRGEFETSRRKDVRWATVFATGSSPEPGRQYVYKLWLNGRFVGLGPVRSVADETRYDGYDVTDLVREGRTNALGAIAWTTSDQRFQAQLVVEYTDGSRQKFGTGADWTTLRGDGVFPWGGSIGTQYFSAPKENLQAAAFPTGFDRPGYDDSAWTPASPRAPYDELVATPTDKVTQRLEYPVEVVEKTPGHYFVDYGRSWVGGLSLDLEGTAGQVVDLRFGEELSAPQTVRFAMRTGNQYQDRWTLRDGRQHLETWGMRVFRYVEVIGAPPGMERRDFPALAQVYPFDRDGAVFDSSDDALNQVWALSRNTVEALNHNLYVDSWTREREPYEADSYLQMMANFFTSSDPTLGNYSIDYLLTRRTWPTEWPMYTILAMHDSFQQTGDVAQLERSYEQLQLKLPDEWIEESTGLIRKDTGSDGCSSRTDCDIVDWPASERDGYVFRPYNTVINALGYRTYVDMAEIATALGHDEDAASYTTTAERLRTAINARMWDDEAGAYVDGLNADGTQVDHRAVHASVFASAFGVPDADRAARTADYIGSRGMACSVYCAAFLVESLYNGDRSDLAHDLLTGTGLRSWLNMIADGAGATAEAWDASLKSNMTYSHPWAASPAYNVPQGMFGIRPTTPGYDTFDVRPQPQSVAWASVTLPTLRGRIGAAFHTVGDRTDVGASVPGNTVASVYVPAAGARHDVVYVDGRPVRAERIRGYLRVDDVTSGCHVFSTVWGRAPQRDRTLTDICH